MAGYQDSFLGTGDKRVQLPTFGPELEAFILQHNDVHGDGDRSPFIAHYHNYSLAMHRIQRTAVYCALNIDQSSFKVVSSSGNWRVDTRIGGDFQLNNDYYRDRHNIVEDEFGQLQDKSKNPYDRGHLARRAAAAWGPTARSAKHASDDTYFYSNASLQHKNFNQDEWVELEDWVKSLSIDKTDKISVFTGPIFGALSRSITPQGRTTALIPSAYFKVVTFINADDQLDARAFIVAQDTDAIADDDGHAMFNFQRYQVSVTEIEEKTGLRFDPRIPEVNPLLFNPPAPDESGQEDPRNIRHTPERIEVDHQDEMINRSQDNRDIVRDNEVPVFIAAAMVNPEGNERDGEWVSIINLSSRSISIEGWKLSDTKRQPLELKGRIQAGEIKRLKKLRPLQLVNTGGVIDLRNAEGERIDRVKYTKAQGRHEGQVISFAERFINHAALA